MTRIQILAGAAVGLVLAGLAVMFLLPAWLYQPLGVCTGRACGYQFWSGIAGSFLIGSGMWTGAAAYYLHHVCHVVGCVRPAWMPHPKHGHPVCSKHHPRGDKKHLHAKRHQYPHTRRRSRRCEARASGKPSSR